MVDRARLKKMMALLAIGIAWAHKTGEWRAAMKPIRLGRHRPGTRPQNSYLRYGLDYIREIMINPCKNLSALKPRLALLSPPRKAQGGFL